MRPAKKSLLPKTLIVDDNQAVSNLISMVIHRLGIPSDIAVSLSETRALLRRRNYDILSLDLLLPDGPGISILRERPSLTTDCIVILITGDHELDCRSQFDCSRAFDFLLKPFTLSVFEQCFAKVLEEWYTRLCRRSSHTRVEKPAEATTGELPCGLDGAWWSKEAQAAVKPG
jgi:DNA-binding NtrC family response regulator